MSSSSSSSVIGGNEGLTEAGGGGGAAAFVPLVLLVSVPLVATWSITGGLVFVRGEQRHLAKKTERSTHKK